VLSIVSHVYPFATQYSHVSPKHPVSWSQDGGVGAGVRVGADEEQVDDERSHGKTPLAHAEAHQNWFVLLVSTRSQVEVGAASHKYDGTSPVKLLERRYREVRLVIALSSTGMVPVSEFELSCRMSRLVIVLSSTGMVPVSEFELSCR
jgi:hypothetical protein